jgi:hypothetical protein
MANTRSSPANFLMQAVVRETSPGPSSQSTKDIRRPNTPPRSLMDDNAALIPLTSGTS